MMPIVRKEPRNRRLSLETAIIFAAWAVFGLLLANQSDIQSVMGGRQMPVYVALRPALLEAGLWAFTTLAIFWLARRFPLERGRVLRGIAGAPRRCRRHRARAQRRHGRAGLVRAVGPPAHLRSSVLGNVQSELPLLCPPARHRTPRALLPALSRARAGSGAVGEGPHRGAAAGAQDATATALPLQHAERDLGAHPRRSEARQANDRPPRRPPAHHPRARGRRRR